jgi:DNA-binding transcriptional ArsR family regulator
MKRDLDLVRKILEKLEEKPEEITQQLKIDNYSDSEIMYHFIIMDEAGLIRCEREVSKSSKIIPDRVIRV